MFTKLLGPNFWTLPIAILFDNYTGEPSDQIKVMFWSSLHPLNFFDYYFEEIYNYSGIPAINLPNFFFFSLAFLIFTYLLRDKLNLSGVSKTLDDILAIGILFPLRVMIYRAPHFFAIAINRLHHLIHDHLGHFTYDWSFEPARRRPTSEMGMSVYRFTYDAARVFAEILYWAYFLGHWALKIAVLSVYACTDWMDNKNAREEQEREWREELEELEREYMRYGFGPLPRRLPPPPRPRWSFKRFWASCTFYGMLRKSRDIKDWIWEWFASWTTSTVEEVHVYRDAESPPRNRGARVRGTRREMESERAVELDRQVRSLQEQIADVKRKTAEARREQQEREAMQYDREAQDEWNRMEMELEVQNEWEAQQNRLEREQEEREVDELFGDYSD